MLPPIHCFGGDVIVCWIFICLQHCLNVSYGWCLYPHLKSFSLGACICKNKSLVVCTRTSAERLFTFFTIGNLLWLSTTQRRILLLFMNTSAPTMVFLVLQTHDALFTMCFMSKFMLIQYTDFVVRSCIFSIPIWFLCRLSSSCICNEKGMNICLLFIATPSSIASLWLTCQYPHRILSKSSLLCGQPLILYFCNICSSASVLITFLMTSTGVHTVTSVAMLSMCMLMFMPAISWSLPSVWLWWDSQSAIYRSGPGLYNMHMYWFMSCSYCHGVAVSLLTIAINDLWSASHWLPLQSSCGTYPNHVVCQGPLILCCHTTTLHWINSCS